MTNTVNTTMETNKGLSKNTLHHYKKILSKKIFNSLSETEKETFVHQIDSVEKDLKHKNTIKIRVRPWVIKLLCKMAGVHDIRGGAYRSDTVYVGHKSDLFNLQLLQHESIHVAQQKELGGFITWLKKTLKDMKIYKEQHGDSPYIQYESSTLTPMELEAYTHQADEGYLQNREPFAYKKYEIPEGEQNAFKKIGDRNDTEIKNQLKEKSPVGKNVSHDLDKLEEIIEKTKDTERTMRVFNSVDKVIELEAITSLLKKKLDILEKKSYSKTDLDKFTTGKEKYAREINNQNLHYIFEEDFTDKEEILKTISRLSIDIHNYRKEPVKLWLEPKKSKQNKSIQVEIPTKSE